VTSGGHWAGKTNTDYSSCVASGSIDIDYTRHSMKFDKGTFAYSIEILDTSRFDVRERSAFNNQGIATIVNNMPFH
jgi:hypothetical protein